MFVGNPHGDPNYLMNIPFDQCRLTIMKNNTSAPE